ncbi:Metallo-dependent phosphatase [Hesseltinella vesiculosa]|uniref:Metallo-dependent phosphatase n=1 Tax=Hesseltinella vesiculosa TaxID=101127 RepID=A0A1X2GA54_9FUNG|nr:Metallo-dependent phosphatase [Hesseltinella vesiculosa]
MKNILLTTSVTLSLCIAAFAYPAAKYNAANPAFTVFAGGDFGWKNWQPLDQRYCDLFNNGVQPLNDCDSGDRSAHATASTEQQLTANFMASVAEKVKPSFLVNVGDNFYSSGLKLNDTFSINRFYAAYVDTYNHSSLNFPWYMTIGNHDILGDVEFETELAHKLDARWIMPSSYYSHDFQQNGVSALFIHYDSDCFISKYQKDSSVYKVPYVVDCNRVKEDQIQFIKSALSNSTHDYKFVLAHHPVWSSSANYTTDLAEINDLVQQHKAIYINGHDHCMALYQQNDVPYILTGGMGLTEPGDCNNGVRFGNFTVKLFASQAKQGGQAPGGFVSMDFTKSELVVNYWTRDGNNIKQASKKPSYSVTVPAALDKQWW